MSRIVDFCSRDFGDTRRVVTGRWRAVAGSGRVPTTFTNATGFARASTVTNLEGYKSGVI